MLTKTDLQEINQLVKTNIQGNNKAIEKIIDIKIQNNNKHLKYFIQSENEDLREDIKQEIQQSKSDIFDKIDPILKEVMANREERTIINHRLTKLEEKLAA